jgi:hypothetical protein
MRGVHHLVRMKALMLVPQLFILLLKTSRRNGNIPMLPVFLALA